MIRSIRCGLAKWIASLVVVVLLGACASGLARHSFSFDAREEPGIELLDYRYGDSRQPGVRADHTQLRDGKVSQSANVSGDILRPDSLYVRWRVQPTGTAYEDTVDLARLLPRDITDHRIHFRVKGQQLFVYLITPRKKAPEEPARGPRPYQYLKTFVLSSNFGRQVTGN